MGKQTLAKTVATVAIAAIFAFLTNLWWWLQKSFHLWDLDLTSVSVNQTNLVIVSILNYQVLPIHILGIVWLPQNVNIVPFLVM